jgi:L-ascorbate metabolism protein UlaG (beta-lactamase superfamily)
MGPADAARAARDCGAQIVIPVHWGEPSSSDEEAQQLASLLPEQVRILERSD